MARKTLKPTSKMPPATVDGEVFTPQIGWLVSNVNLNVFLDPVIEITDTGFVCKSTGLWSGTKGGWRSHNITPREED